MACRAFALAPLHDLHDLAEFADLEPGLAGERVDLVAVLLDPVLVFGGEAPPAFGRELRHAVEPERVELRTQIVLEEILARHAMALGEPHQAALAADEALVDVVELLDQRVDARLVQPQRFHLADDLVLQLLIVAFLRGRERLPFELELDILILQPAQALVGVGDGVEGLDHLGLELRLDCGDREPILHIVVVVEVALADRPGGSRLSPPAEFAGRLEGCRSGWRSGRRPHLRRPGWPGTATPTINWPSGPIAGAGIALASGPA